MKLRIIKREWLEFPYDVELYAVTWASLCGAEWGWVKLESFRTVDGAGDYMRKYSLGEQFVAEIDTEAS